MIFKGIIQLLYGPKDGGVSVFIKNYKLIKLDTKITFSLWLEGRLNDWRRKYIMWRKGKGLQLGDPLWRAFGR